MNLTVEIPDDLGNRLAAGGDDLARRALEGFALEEYNAGYKAGVAAIAWI
jgi:hypothetical protein